jgi:hypothetical protein
MKTSVHERVMCLVRHALSATANENEAHSAALLVCRTILRYPDLLNTKRFDDVSDGPELEVPACGHVRDTSGMHPPTNANLEWEMFKRHHRIELRRAVYPGLCIACGQWYGIDDHVLQHVHVGVTHEACTRWWRYFDFRQVAEKGLEDLVV